MTELNFFDPGQEFFVVERWDNALDDCHGSCVLISQLRHILS